MSASHRARRGRYDIRRTTARFADILAAVRVKPRVLMVTGAYFPETSGGGLQARAVIRALRGTRRDFAVLTTSADPSLPAHSEEDGVAIRRVHVDVAERLVAGHGAPSRLAAAFVAPVAARRHRQPARLLAKAILLVALSRSSASASC